MKPAGRLSITREGFGALPDGRPVSLYRLANGRGIQVAVLTYGGIVQSITMPDRHGRIEDIALGFDELAGYRERGAYFGALIGRYANRIAGGRFALDGAEYRLPLNNGTNSLHGGTEGFNSRLWAASEIRSAGAVGVELSYLSPDGEMGYPGNLAVTVRYSLDGENRLRLDYSAVTDRATVLNLTNHSYFNLAGAGRGTILDQVAMIDASRVTPVDARLLPTGALAPVESTPLDFTEPRPIGSRIRAEHPQLSYAEPEQGGYDFNYVLNRPGDLAALAARVTDPGSGRVLELYTSEPGVQFYTSNLFRDLPGKDGRTYQHWGAFTLEAQHFPDSPNQAHFPSTELRPGARYRQTTIYKFGAE